MVEAQRELRLNDRNELFDGRIPKWHGLPDAHAYEQRLLRQRDRRGNSEPERSIVRNGRN